MQRDNNAAHAHSTVDRMLLTAPQQTFEAGANRCAVHTRTSALPDECVAVSPSPLRSGLIVTNSLHHSCSLASLADH